MKILIGREEYDIPIDSSNQSVLTGEIIPELTKRINNIIYEINDRTMKNDRLLAILSVMLIDEMIELRKKLTQVQMIETVTPITITQDVLFQDENLRTFSKTQIENAILDILSEIEKEIIE